MAKHNWIWIGSDLRVATVGPGLLADFIMLFTLKMFRAILHMGGQMTAGKLWEMRSTWMWTLWIDRLKGGASSAELSVLLWPLWLRSFKGGRAWIRTEPTPVGLLSVEAHHEGTGAGVWVFWVNQWWITKKTKRKRDEESMLQLPSVHFSTLAPTCAQGSAGSSFFRCVLLKRSRFFRVTSSCLLFVSLNRHDTTHAASADQSASPQPLS